MKQLNNFGWLVLCRDFENEGAASITTELDLHCPFIFIKGIRDLLRIQCAH